MSENRQLRLGTILHGASGNMSAWRHPAAQAAARISPAPRPARGRVGVGQPGNVKNTGQELGGDRQGDDHKPHRARLRP
ncbi:hypothetical protein, partial [Klebsiella pneumoniae]|uniref:hypothetical protein n=1 Tax=Klebsiella pneumoniae TaxID=573 RepID=UPI003CC99A31